MPEVTINWVSILAAGLASMAVGFLWYSPMLFGKQWITLMGWSEKKMTEGKQNMQKTYMISFVMSLLMAFVLTHTTKYAGTFYQMSGVQLGLMSAFWSWLGFVMPVQLTDWLFGGKKFQLFAINTGYQLVSLLSMGVMITIWM